MTLSESFDDRFGFEIGFIEEAQPPTPNEIQFEYPNPQISIDTGGVFAKHDIIGGATVRQRIGRQPMQVSIEGVCEQDTANKLEQLRNATQGSIYSNRFTNNGLVVQFISVSTDPMEAGGAADIQSGELLYSFSLECVEVLGSGN